MFWSFNLDALYRYIISTFSYFPVWTNRPVSNQWGLHNWSRRLLRELNLPVLAALFPLATGKNTHLEQCECRNAGIGVKENLMRSGLGGTAVREGHGMQQDAPCPLRELHLVGQLGVVVPIDSALGSQVLTSTMRGAVPPP